jgi:hypothetical protein
MSSADQVPVVGGTFRRINGETIASKHLANGSLETRIALNQENPAARSLP